MKQLTKEERKYRNASNLLHESTHDFIDEEGMTPFLIECMRGTIQSYISLAEEHGVSKEQLLEKESRLYA